MTTLPNTAISSSDELKIKAYLLETEYKILAAALARVYYAHPDPNEWRYTGLEGVLVFVRDDVSHRNEFCFKLVDITCGGGIIWEHEVGQGDFEYEKDAEYFHSFSGDVSPSLFEFEGV
jgi:Wiskott-Aldrich syndrome protein